LIRCAFGLEHASDAGIVLVPLVKSKAPSLPHPATLAKKRALIRALIERNGWSIPPGTTGEADGKTHEIPIAANVIPFPTAEDLLRASP
jgi:hypothetical protein